MMNTKVEKIKKFLEHTKTELTEDDYLSITTLMADKEGWSDEFAEGVKTGFDLGVDETIDTLIMFFEKIAGGLGDEE